MVIDQIHIPSVAIFQPEDHPPIRPDGHAPEIPHFALQGMQLKAWQIHIARPSGPAQDRQNIFDFLDLIGTNSLGFALLVQPLQPLMTETLNQKTLYV